MMKNLKLKRPKGRFLYLTALLFGAAYPLGLAPLGWWPVLLASVAGLLWLLDGQSNNTAFRVAYVYGVGLFGVGASWVHVSIHQFGHAPLPLSILLTLLFVLFLALFKALIGVGVAYCQHRWRDWAIIVGFSVLWWFSEWLLGHFLTGFPWLYLGHGLVDSPLSGWLALVGALNSGLVVVWVIAISYWLFIQAVTTRRTKVLAMGLLASILVAVSQGYWAWATRTDKPSQNLTVALVQPNIPQDQKWRPENLRTYLERYDVMTEALWGADLIVWPEAAIPAVKHRVENWLQYWQRLANQSGSTLLLGIPIYDSAQQKIYASMIALGASEQRYDKQRLVPFGEFVPFESVLRGLIEFFNLPMSGMSPGNESQPPLETEKLNVIPAICYEVAYPDVFEKALKHIDNQKVSAIVTISNDAWFGHSWGPHQHFQIARARAIEFGLPLIRSTNTGITAIVDYQGRVVAQIPQFQQKVLTKNYTFENQATPYAKMPLITWLSIVVTLVLISHIVVIRE
jgi:apolipoprotein N-acyltransferase